MHPTDMLYNPGPEQPLPNMCVTVVLAPYHFLRQMKVRLGFRLSV